MGVICILAGAIYGFYIQHISTTATQLRGLFGVTIDSQKQIKKLEDAFEYWRDCFYRVGVYVFKEAFKDNSVSGFCIYDSTFPIICINNRTNGVANRRRLKEIKRTAYK